MIGGKVFPRFTNVKLAVSFGADQKMMFKPFDVVVAEIAAQVIVD